MRLMLNTPRIHVTPGRRPVDGTITIQLAGFPPSRVVTVRARLSDRQGRDWSSHAVFQTDGSGAVDLATACPVSGSYAGADVAGLVWSLAPEGDAQKAPFEESNLKPFQVTFAAELEGAPGASATIERSFLPADCLAVKVREDGLVGTLYRPAGDGPFPTVLVVGGSQGGQGFSGQCAALLAGHGYASLALSYFADEGLPAQLVEIPLEYFGRALGWLGAQPYARDDRPAIVGRSRGGELALLLGATFPRVRTVVAYCPSNVVWGGIRGTNMANESAWSYRGRPVPHVRPSLTLAQQNEIFGSRPIALCPLFDLPIDPLALSAAEIPVERIRGAVTLLSGDEDRMWPAGRMCEAVIERLANRHHPYPFAHHSYAGAGHLLRAPCVPTSIIDAPIMALGGVPAGQARANRQSWTEVLRALAC
jgi:dienelactone hydrolase